VAGEFLGDLDADTAANDAADAGLREGVEVRDPAGFIAEWHAGGVQVAAERCAWDVEGRLPGRFGFQPRTKQVDQVHRQSGANQMCVRGCWVPEKAEALREPQPSLHLRAVEFPLVRPRILVLEFLTAPP